MQVVVAVEDFLYLRLNGALGVFFISFNVLLY